MPIETLHSRIGVDPHFNDSPLKKETYEVEVLGKKQDKPLADVIDETIGAINDGEVLAPNELAILDNIVKFLRRSVSSFSTEHQALVRTAISTIDEVRQNSGRQKEVNQMTVAELVNEITTTIDFSTERGKRIMDRFLIEVGAVKDEKLKQMYRVQVAAHYITIVGDVGQKDWSIWEPSVIEVLRDKEIEPIDIVRGLFLIPTDKNREHTAEDLNKPEHAEINDRLIQMYDYVILRIRGAKKGGLDSDPESKLHGNLDFSYSSLVLDRVDKFKEHLKAKFADVDPVHLGIALNLYQTEEKTKAYAAYLAGETTRGHGNQKGGAEVKFVDVLARRAWFALGFYSRGRYFKVNNATGEDLNFVSQSELERIVRRGNSDATIANSKIEENTLFRDVVEKFRIAVWGKIPKFVQDVRTMTSTPVAVWAREHNEWYLKTGIKDQRLLDVEDNWFPMPIELIINILKVEQEKRRIDAMPATSPVEVAAKNADKVKLLNFCKAESYGSQWDVIGLQQLISGKITWSQYNLADTKMDDFVTTFYKGGENLSKHAAEAKLNDWLKDVMGKIKLMPGKHHRIMGPQTVRLVHSLSHQYVGRGDRRKVEELQLDFGRAINNSTGVDPQSKSYALRELHYDASHDHVEFQPTLWRALREEEKRKFFEALAYYLKRHSKNPLVQARLWLRGVPTTQGLTDEDGVRLVLEAPWDVKKTVSADTSEKH